MRHILYLFGSQGYEAGAAELVLSQISTCSAGFVSLDCRTHCSGYDASEYELSLSSSIFMFRDCQY